MQSKTKISGPKRMNAPKFLRVSIDVSVGLIALDLSMIPMIHATGIKRIEITMKVQ